MAINDVFSQLVIYGAMYSRMDQVKIFNSCLPQILPGLFLNTLSHIFTLKQNKACANSVRNGGRSLDIVQPQKIFVLRKFENQQKCSTVSGNETHL